MIGVVVSSIMMLVLKKSGATNENQEVKNPISDTVVVAAQPEVQIERVVEKVNVPSNDTVMLLTNTVMLLTNINQNVDSGDYVVLRDELLSSRKVNILQKSKTSSGSPSDALIDRVSSDDFFAESILVEFWESPIDYQGYRLNKTKLILFGINPNESFELTNQHEGFLLLNSGGQTVILYPTEKYRTFNFQ